MGSGGLARAVLASLAVLAAAVPAGAAAQGPGDGGEFTWTVPDRLVTAPDRRLVYANEPEKVRSGPWQVDFRVKPDRCRTSARYSWSVDGGDAINLEDTCEFQYTFDEEGEHEVKLEISAPGVERSSEAKVTVQDWLVVAVGDSVASGEGNPELTRPRWQDPTCHRSGHAGAAQAALALERRDPTTSVTFVHLACSGASIEEGMLDDYGGIAPSRRRGAHEAQVTAAKRVAELAGRDIDAIILSVGANDVHFGPAVAFCITYKNCPDRRFDPKHPLSPPFANRGRDTLRRTVSRQLDRLPQLYDQLAGMLGEELNQRVHLVEYFDPTHASGDRFCRIGRITPTVAEFAFRDILGRLNAAVDAATTAEGRGWRLVRGTAAEFREHGYCVRGRAGWVVRLRESARRQLSIRPRSALAGTLHPNERGHRATAGLILASLTGALPAQAEQFDSNAADDDDEDVEDVEDHGRWVLGGLAGSALLLGAGGAAWRRRPRRTAVAEEDRDETSRGDRQLTRRDQPTIQSVDAEAEDREALGLSVLELSATSGDWVHRRVESVTFLDVASVHRRVSVDFTLPRAAQPSEDAMALVPLAVLEKRPLTNFDLLDESGKSLPLLTRSENNELTLEGLRAHARRVVGVVDDDLDKMLRTVVGAEPTAAHEAHEAIETKWPALGADARFSSRSRMLAGNFPLVVRVAGAARRRVVKFSYETRRPSRSPATHLPSWSPARRLWRYVRRKWFRMRVGLGWKALRDIYHLPNLGDAASHHFEVVGEGDLEVWVEIRAVRPAAGGGWRRVEAAGERAFGGRTHAYVADAPHGSFGFALVRMRTRRAGLLRGAPWIAGLTAGLLTAIWFWLPDVTESARQVAPLFLVIPSILGAYLGRPGEHPLVSEMLLGPRVMLVAGGFAALVSALVLAAGGSVTALRWVVGASAVVAWLLVFALVRSRRGPRV